MENKFIPFDSEIDHTCSECGVKYILSFSNDIATIMNENTLCFGCAFWQHKLKNPNNQRVVIDNKMYYIDTAIYEKQHRGFAGQKFTIKKDNGDIIETDNLWYNGDIPSHFRNRIPNNAQFLKF